ncbi:hypothetical protein [Calothrix sp. 336/3]|uniref:hypothetical protein n=1 Tax=Calothrix sp. 336/3 TaxID=1337936 RepID=UPI0004E3E7C5|nr:hypothetical protein [Calothrix sp. 336/3]AKG22913.1 hypothetical protein IJ00_17980 [Calothrix sp. 336/3]
MGRWTPLILMAGGLAILLGTLLGISFPMGQQSAQAPAQRNQESKVLPANINVNSTASDNGSSNRNRTSVAQNNAPEETTPDATDSTTTAQDTTPSRGVPTNDTTETPTKNEPIRALW